MVLTSVMCVCVCVCEGGSVVMDLPCEAGSQFWEVFT